MKKHHIALAITTITTVVGILGIVKGGTLPMHWKINGEVDRWGNSGELLIPMGIAIALYLLFWFFEKHPEADLKVIFAVLDNDILTLGKNTVDEIAVKYKA